MDDRNAMQGRETGMMGRMRSTTLLNGLAMMALFIGQAHGQAAIEPVNPATPKAIALVAAIGDRFSVIYEVEGKGSHLEPFRRSVIEAPDDLLNRIALQTLDREVARARPDDKRIYLSLPAAPVYRVAPALRESHAIAKVIAELEKMPQRLEWDRILVVTPAYRAHEHDGMASKLQGFGIFMQPLKSGLSNFLAVPAYRDVLAGDDVDTPGDGIRRSETYLAPFAYLAITILDPKTLAVIDTQRRFDSLKLADPLSGSLDISQSFSRDYLARRVVGLIEKSIHEAVQQTELAGKVEIREIREVGGAEIAPIPGSR
jgi:hypothetical protein